MGTNPHSDVLDQRERERERELSTVCVVVLQPLLR